MLKKGVWTWIKIHIGGALGLFKKESLKLSTIAAVIFEAKKDNHKDGALSNVLKSKAWRWNSRRSEDLIPMKAVKFEEGSNFHKWDKLEKGEIANAIIHRMEDAVIGMKVVIFVFINLTFRF